MTDSWIVLLVALGAGLGLLLAVVLSVTPRSAAALRRRLLEHLALCAGRGLPLGPAVAALADEVRPRWPERSVTGLLLQVGSPATRQAALLDRIAAAVDATGSLAGALEEAPELGFTPERVALLHAAERCGALPEVLAQLADEQLALEDARAGVSSLVIYPTLMGVLIGGVALFMTLVIQPKFKEIFDSMGVDPGPLNGAWGAAEEAAPFALWTLAGVVVAAALARRRLRGPCLRAAERAPLVGQAIRRWRSGQALQRVSAFLRAGSTLPEAFEHAARASLGRAATRAADAAAVAREGRPPLAAIERLLGPDAPALAARVALEVERAPAFADGVLAAGTSVTARARADLAARLLALRVVPIFACALVVGAMHFAVWTPILRLQTYLVEGPS